MGKVMMTNKIYIAHTEEIDPELIDKIKKVITELNYVPVDPFDLPAEQSLVHTDLMEILSSEMVVAVLCEDNYSIGTPMEMVYARIFGKPVLTVLLSSSLVNHHWVKEHSTTIMSGDKSTYMYLSFEDGFKYVFKSII